ncbi:hypothetical protein [Streptomyces sp. NPDC049744]
MLVFLVILSAMVFAEGLLALIQVRVVADLLHRVEALEKRPRA